MLLSAAYLLPSKYTEIHIKHKLILTIDVAAAGQPFNCKLT